MLLEFLAEVDEVLLVQPVLEERTRVVPGGGMALEIDHVGHPPAVAPAEHMVEAHLVQGGQGGERGDVPAHAEVARVGADHHRHRVPAHMGPDQPLHLEVAGVLGLLMARDGVEVGRAGDVGNAMAPRAQAADEVRDDDLALLRGLPGEDEVHDVFNGLGVPGEVGGHARALARRVPASFGRDAGNDGWIEILQGGRRALTPGDTLSVSPSVPSMGTRRARGREPCLLRDGRIP